MRLALALALVLSSASAQEQCGGSFSTFLGGIRREALMKGYDRRAVEAFLIGAAMLHGLGWRPNEPWLQEVTVPSDLDWSQSGIDRSIRVSVWAHMGVRPRWGDLPRSSMNASACRPMPGLPLSFCDACKAGGADCQGV